MFFWLFYDMDRITMHLFFKMNTLTSLVCLSACSFSVCTLGFGLQGRLKEV